MTASSPRPAGNECTCGEFAGTSVRYADCPVHCPRPAAPDTTGGELLARLGYPHDPQLVAALRDLLAERDKLAAQVQAVEGLAEEISTEHQDWCCAKGCTYPEKRHSDPNDSITVEELRGIFSANPPPLIEHRTIPCPRDCTCHAQPDADRLRRALGTPTTGGGE